MAAERRGRDGRRGSVWVVLVFLIIAAWAAMAAALTAMASQYRSLSRLHLMSEALYLAEGGVAKAQWELSRDAGYAGEADVRLETGTFSVVVQGDEVTATGYVPDRIGARQTQTIAVKVRRDNDTVRVLSWRRR